MKDTQPGDIMHGFPTGKKVREIPNWDLNQVLKPNGEIPTGNTS